MNPTDLLKHFDRLSEAPDALTRLRGFILDLAVRGRLVEQYSTDEPASELLRRPGPRKAATTSKSIGRESRPPQIPFEVPESWEWVHLIDLLTKLTDGTHHSPINGPNGEFKYITAKNIKPEGISLANVSYVSAAIHREIYARCNPEKGDVLYIKDGATTGVVTINNLEERFSMLSSVALLKPSDAVQNRLLVIFLRSPFFYDQMRGLMKGAAITRVTLKRMAPALLPLPPIAEQHRIVAKVDELMALCDELEAVQTERECRRNLVVSVSLNRLNAPSDDGSGFREDARFHLRHLPRLITRTDHLVDLRQTLLRLLVTGRMIRRHRDSTRSHREFPSTPLYPAHWVLAPLSEVAAQIVDCPHSTPKWEAAGKICVRTNQFRPGYLDLKDSRYVSNATYEERIERLRPIRDDILYSREGGILGVACRIPPNVDLCLGQRMLLIRAGEQIAPAFLELVLNSPVITDIARRETTGGAAPRVNVSTVRAYPIPVPPLSEQLEIVSTFQNLMSLCDRLEARLTATQTESRRFLESTLHEALRAPSEIAAPA